MNQMNLDINNFGPIKNANIELKKLNVIAGINGSGKSTSSKLLSCFITASSKEGNYLANTSIFNRFNSLVRDIHNAVSLSEPNNKNLNDILLMLDNTPDLNENSFNDYIQIKIDELNNILSESNLINKNDLLERLKEFNGVFKVHCDEHHRYFNISNVLLGSEFNFFELDLPKDFNVHFYGESDVCEFSHEIVFDENRLGAIINEGYLNCLNIEDVVYIDSPSIFEYNDTENILRLDNLQYHLKFLSRLLTSKKDEDVYDNHFNQEIIKIQNKIKEKMGGFIYFDSRKNEFMFKKNNKTYSMKNTASGVKQLGIIQLLLENRVLKKNCFLIIDEPELNLHPQWQVSFAEILVLMIKELNISIYINSHSPQFVEALEVYSAKYDLIDDSKFYLSVETSEDKFIFEEILREDLVILYDNLGNPYDTINQVRAANMKNGIF